MSHRRRAGRALAGIALLAVAAVASAGPAGAATHTITQFTIKSLNNQPGDMTIGNDGNVWFVDQGTSKIAKIGKGGAITGFLMPKGSHPLGITTASDGATWFTETAVNRVGHTATGAQPIPQVTLPATIKSPRGITAGPDGNVYLVGYTTHNVAEMNVGNPHNPHVIATLPAGSGPVRITSGPDGNLWVTESLIHSVAKVTPGGGVTQFALPNGAAPSRIVSGPDGNLWVTEPGINKVAIIDTSGAIVGQITIAGKPTGITSGADNFMWATLQGTGRIARIPVAAPRTIKTFAIPTAGSLPSGITVGSDGNIWFSETGKNKIGRLADAPGHTSFVTVNDHGYAPQSQGVPLSTGKNHTPVKVEWLFRCGKSHSVTDSTAMGLFDSGSQAPGTNFIHTFSTAGTFSYGSTVGSDTMSGTIKVVPSAVLSGGNIIVTVGTSVPAGVTTDVQVEVPGSNTFTVVGNNVAGTTFTYNPSAHGVYKFQVRTNKGGASSGFSPTARATF
jgi:streptogramin lyase